MVTICAEVKSLDWVRLPKRWLYWPRPAVVALGLLCSQNGRAEVFVVEAGGKGECSLADDPSSALRAAAAKSDGCVLQSEVLRGRSVFEISCATLKVFVLPALAECQAVAEAKTFVEAKEMLQEMERPDLTRLRMGSISQALEIYRIKEGRYPTEGEGLRMLLNKPSKKGKYFSSSAYLESSDQLSDSWGSPFRYRVGQEGIRLDSNGKDKKPETSDDIMYSSPKYVPKH